MFVKVDNPRLELENEITLKSLVERTTYRGTKIHWALLTGAKWTSQSVNKSLSITWLLSSWSSVIILFFVFLVFLISVFFQPSSLQESIEASSTNDHINESHPNYDKTEQNKIKDIVTVHFCSSWSKKMSIHSPKCLFHILAKLNSYLSPPHPFLSIQWFQPTLDFSLIGGSGGQSSLKQQDGQWDQE